MARRFSLSALNERLAMAIASGFSRKFRAPLVDLFVELVGRHHGIDHAHVVGLFRRVAAAQIPDLPRPLLADEAREIRGAESWIDRADLGPDLPEYRLLRRDGQIAQGRQHIAAADGEALHAGDHRLRHVANERLQFVDRQPNGAAALVGASCALWSAPVQNALSPALPSTITATDLS